MFDFYGIKILQTKLKLYIIYSKEKASLKKYGILTPEEKAEEEAREEIRRQERRKRQEEDRRLRIQEERKRWWEGAICLYGPLDIDNENGEKIVTDDSTQDEMYWDERRLKIIERYSSNYDRWSDHSFQPNDPVSIEEAEEKRMIKEQEECEVFERANKEFCDSFRADFEKRNRKIRDKKQSVNSLRVKGNRLFRSKSYKEALFKYQEAFNHDPFDQKVLLNIALCHIKMQAWNEALEFCNRSCHIDKANVKALFNRSLVFIKMMDFDKAMIDLEKCRSLDPSNDEVMLRYDAISREVVTSVVERKIEGVLGIDDSTSNKMNEIDARIAFFELFNEHQAGHELNNRKSRLLFKLLDYLFQVIRCNDKSDQFYGNFSNANACVFLLKHYPVSQVYLRKSGILDSILTVLLERESCPHPLDSPSTLTQSKIDSYFAILAESIRFDLKAKGYVLSVSTCTLVMLRMPEGNK